MIFYEIITMDYQHLSGQSAFISQKSIDIIQHR
jgi:hypothetical protein